MPFCPKCNAIYNEGAAACSACGQPLMASSSSEELIDVYDAVDARWAEAAKAALRRAGIPATERSAGDAITADGRAVYSRIFVPRSRVLDARWAIASALSGPGYPVSNQAVGQAVPGMPLRPHNGSTILVLGILSIVFCQILGPIAWIMGNNDMKEIDAGRMDPVGKDTTNAGRICGMIGTCILGLAVIAIVVAILVTAASAPSIPPSMFD